MFSRFLTFIVIVVFYSVVNISSAAEWSGKISSEFRYFSETPTDSVQYDQNVSLSVEPEFYHEWQNDQSILIKYYQRWDQGDDNRSNYDVREFFWQKVSDNWELKIGIVKIYWGVTESQHLVDIINQTDLIDSFDGEEKLGQSMFNLSLIESWATIDFFVLPAFRARTFPGIDGRLRSFPNVDVDQARYESSEGYEHIDYALRVFQNVREWDIGLSYFTGTSRDPRFIIGQDKQAQVVLIPYYDLIEQASVDVQATFDTWLWKLEWIHRSGQGRAFNAATAGFEYTFYQIFESDLDLGLLVEYLYDDRGDLAATPFEDDIFLGSRLTFNDTQSTDLLVGFISDLNNINPSIRIEGSRRLSDHWKIVIESQIFKEKAKTDPSNAFRNDDFIQLELEYYY